MAIELGYGAEEQPRIGLEDSQGVLREAEGTVSSNQRCVRQTSCRSLAPLSNRIFGRHQSIPTGVDFFSLFLASGDRVLRGGATAVRTGEG